PASPASPARATRAWERAASLRLVDEPRAFEADIRLGIHLRCNGLLRRNTWRRDDKAGRRHKHQRRLRVGTYIELLDRVGAVEAKALLREGVIRMRTRPGRRQVEEIDHPDLLALTAGALQVDGVQTARCLVVLQTFDDQVGPARR